LEKAKAEAKKKKKKIFIDVFTTWCGPCKEMAKTTFTDAEVGKVFNDKFVNVKMDAENDTDGSLISSNYKVTAYPTLLFLDENGKLIKKLVGKQSKEKLIQVANGI
jgi:thiol:disulfide interchange protein